MAFADDPAEERLKKEPELYGYVSCSGLDPLTLAATKIDFDKDYGAGKGFGGSEDPQWVTSYPLRMNEFGRQFGCGPLFDANGKLTMKAKVTIPVYEKVHYRYHPVGQE